MSPIARIDRLFDEWMRAIGGRRVPIPQRTEREPTRPITRD